MSRKRTVVQFHLRSVCIIGWLGLLCLCLWGWEGYAQNVPLRGDSASHKLADSVLINRDSVFYHQLKQRMYKRRLTRAMYDLLFRDVYNSRIQTGEVNQIEANPFQEHEGKIIGDIFIRRLEVFGQTVYDTTRYSANWIERVANRLHRDTREGVIRRSFLLFQKGDVVDPNQLRDNERLLRSSNIFHDARIVLVPRPGSTSFVDVYVITQDVWSLLPGGAVGALNRWDLTLENRNLWGYGHTIFNSISYRGLDTLQRLDYRGRYFIPYIGRNLISLQADLIHERDYRQAGIRVFRPFLTPDTRVAGSAELSYIKIPRNRIFTSNISDSARFFSLSYNYSDVWLGYAFRPITGFMDPEDRTRLVLAGRLTSYNFLRRPEVTSDTNQLYQNRSTVLFSFGFSTRRYTRDVLVYGFGRTEDVPYGCQLSIVSGIDYAELGERMYMGLKYSKGGYIRKFGYLYTLLNIGGFMKSDRGVQQGTLSLEANYFSPLRTTSWGNWRHFVNVRYVEGLNRFNNEFVTLSGRDRFGLTNDALRGTKFLLTNFENVLFSKLDVLGFRMAIIPFVNLGLISYDKRRIWDGPLYQNYGIGFRFRNENLTFNSFQIRLAWYPNLPNNPQALRFAFDAVPALRFRDFDVSAPEIISYR